MDFTLINLLIISYYDNNKLFFYKQYNKYQNLY